MCSDNLLSRFGVGKRAPADPFFGDGNLNIPFFKRFGIVEEDDEELLHDPIPRFVCNFFNCKHEFDTIYKYEQHYNMSHRFSCVECHKLLESPHLLDLHLSEVHDSYFAVQVGRKPMFRCYVEECPDIFMDERERKEHAIQTHKLPIGFFSLNQPKLKQKKKKNTKKSHVKESGNGMEVDVLTTTNKSTNFGARPRNGRVLASFTKDLANSLPQL